MVCRMVLFGSCVDTLVMIIWLEYVSTYFPKIWVFPKKRSTVCENPLGYRTTQTNTQKKKQFTDQAKGWAKSWNDLITKGINNQLTVGEVQSHRTINGVSPKTSRATSSNQKGSYSEDGGDAMAKLKKLKAMFEAELITQDEYEAKKSEILSSM